MGKKDYFDWSLDSQPGYFRKCSSTVIFLHNKFYNKDYGLKII